MFVGPVRRNIMNIMNRRTRITPRRHHLTLMNSSNGGVNMDIFVGIVVIIGRIVNSELSLYLSRKLRPVKREVVMFYTVRNRTARLDHKKRDGVFRTVIVRGYLTTGVSR